MSETTYEMPTTGDILRIDYMEGEPQYVGKIGTVEYVDDAKQIHGTWGGCALIPGSDVWTVLTSMEKCLRRNE